VPARGPAGAPPREPPEEHGKVPQKRPDIVKGRGYVDYSKWEQLQDSEDEEDELAEPATSSTRYQDDDRAKLRQKEWKGRYWSESDRNSMVDDMLAVCRDSLGFVPLDEPPRHVKLPPDHRKDVGILTVAQLATYSCSNERMLTSVHGDIYDVSSRPDLYGNGPKSFHSGKDITWGLIIGSVTPKTCNLFYDIFKLDEDHMTRFLQIICNRIVHLETEFGEPVGRLDKFVRESELPPPPLEDIDECTQQ